jgi:hypothetical protein
MPGHGGGGHGGGGGGHSHGGGGGHHHSGGGGSHFRSGFGPWVGPDYVETVFVPDENCFIDQYGAEICVNPMMGDAPSIFGISPTILALGLVTAVILYVQYKNDVRDNRLAMGD